MIDKTTVVLALPEYLMFMPIVINTDSLNVQVKSFIWSPKLTNQHALHIMLYIGEQQEWSIGGHEADIVSYCVLYCLQACFPGFPPINDRARVGQLVWWHGKGGATACCGPVITLSRLLFSWLINACCWKLLCQTTKTVLLKIYWNLIQIAASGFMVEDVHVVTEWKSGITCDILHAKCLKHTLKPTQLGRDTATREPTLHQLRTVINCIYHLSFWWL